MKNIIGIILAIAIGIFIGFFGVVNSVFSDGPMDERLVFIGIILVVYAGLGAVWGFLLPERGWKWGLYLGVPGAVGLLLFMLSEFTLFGYFLLYAAALLAVACLGAWGGARLRTR
ncbi:MAG TPA: hypothetical protein P5309_03635 [Syntrophomonadaceae bacterium]|nr:hypothetical protein [Syntrophomonadaceae bacterium]